MGKNVEVTHNANQFTQNAKESTRCHHVIVPIIHCNPGVGGVFWSKLWSSQIRSFPWGGVFRSKLKSSQIQSFPWEGGVFQSKLKSSHIQSFPWGGGYSGVNFGHPKSRSFPWEGGVFRTKLWSGKFGPKFTVQPETCLCITVVSHTLCVWRLMTR